MLQGSGKTLAFGLPILHSILLQRERAEPDSQPQEQGLQGLIFAPTRELALQARAHADRLALSIACVGLWQLLRAG